MTRLAQIMEAERRFADGVPAAARMLYRDAVGVQELGTRNLSVTLPKMILTERANGSGGSILDFSGYASVVNAGYKIRDMFGEYEETMLPGAWGATLAAGADFSFLVNHDGPTLARTKSGTLRGVEDSTGFLSLASLDLSREDVRVLRSAVERGDWDEMSFAFRVTEQQWSEDYDRRFIMAVDMNRGDQSVVNYGANPHTAGTVGVSSRRLSRRRADSLRDSLVLKRLVDQRRDASTLNPTDLAALFGLLAQLAAADEALDPIVAAIVGADSALDAAQAHVADMLGVDDPDDDDEPTGMSHYSVIDALTA